MPRIPETLINILSKVGQMCMIHTASEKIPIMIAIMSNFSRKGINLLIAFCFMAAIV